MGVLLKVGSEHGTKWAGCQRSNYDRLHVHISRGRSFIFAVLGFRSGHALKQWKNWRLWKEALHFGGSPHSGDTCRSQGPAKRFVARFSSCDSSSLQLRRRRRAVTAQVRRISALRIHQNPQSQMALSLFSTFRHGLGMASSHQIRCARGQCRCVHDDISGPLLPRSA